MEITPNQVCEDLLQFLQHFKVVTVELAEKQGLTPVQMAALCTIKRQNELLMGKVADALHCDASNVTGIVDKLVAQDLVARHECPNDRRAKALRLTEKGKQMAEEIMDTLPQALGCHTLAANERAMLHAVLLKLSR